MLERGNFRSGPSIGAVPPPEFHFEREVKRYDGKD
jgi:hypothetical protein